MFKFLISLLTICGISSCQKCYVCESKNTARANFCEGNPNYDKLKNGETVKDAFGIDYLCKEKK